MKKEHNLKVATILRYLILSMACVIMIVPFVAMIFNSVKPEAEILGYPPTFIPRSLTLKNFKDIFSNSSLNLKTSMINSIFITVIRTALTIYFAAFWAYALCKIYFRGRKVLFYLVLSAMMIPTSVILIPLYQEMIWIKLKGTFLSLIIITNATTSYAVFIMKQFMESVPSDIIEAGRIDGCNEFQIFHKLVFPLLKNAISAISIIVFLYVWNDFLWPYMMMDNPKKFTITVAMQFLNGRNYIKYGQLMAATAISLVPIFLIFLLFQKHFIQGIALSGSKE